MLKVTLISLALIFATSCLLLSILPLLAPWAAWLRLVGLLFALAGILALIYSLFTD